MNTFYEERARGLVNLSPHPPIPKAIARARVVKHQHHKLGKTTIRQQSDTLYLSDREIEVVSVPTRVTGHTVLEGLVRSDRKVLNANVLNHLLTFLELIPGSWAGLRIYFWGTIYQNPTGQLFVTYLDYREERKMGIKSLSNSWFDKEPAAVFAKS